MLESTMAELRKKQFYRAVKLKADTESFGLGLGLVFEYMWKSQAHVKNIRLCMVES